MLEPGRRPRRAGKGWIITGLIALTLFLAAETAAGLLPDLFKAAFGERPRYLALGTAAALAVAGTAMYIRYRRSRTETADGLPEITPERLQRARNGLLHRVHQTWTRDLDHRWDDTVRIELGLLDSPDAVDDPWAATRLTTQTGTPLPHGTRMRTVYEQHGSQLLVLGAPGAGKTVHMLELTQALAERAMTDGEAPVPVFLWTKSIRVATSNAPPRSTDSSPPTGTPRAASQSPAEPTSTRPSPSG
ncbi:hypothetical protein AB0F11_27175 [Streptomyces sp. NPDC032472]|uniref:hypothetical protein n=1 Tax=Streptomyces sp. NPDC032472 TaxID=3155018 RepID=UPI0033CFEF5B